MTYDKFFERATDIHLMTGFLGQSGVMGLGEQNSVGFHFQQIGLLLERAAKLPTEAWAPTVCNHFGSIEIIDKHDPLWRDKLEAIVAAMSEKCLAEGGQTPAWLAFSVLENLASLKIFALRHEPESDEEPGHYFGTIYRTAERWILEDVSPILTREI